MNAKPPETFGLDRLQTPIGIALLVTDAEGALCALEWEDFELRLRQLLRLQYGATVLQDAPAPHDIRAALTGYFKGDLDRLSLVKWRELRRAGGTARHAESGARGRPRQRLQSDQRRRALSSRDRRRRLADRLWRRDRAQAMAAAARRRGVEVRIETRCLMVA